jgi:hypothetical protein
MRDPMYNYELKRKFESGFIAGSVYIMFIIGIGEALNYYF